MTLIARFRSLITGLLRRKSMESSMADEMSFHIEAYTRDLIRSGVPSAEAERRARVEFGGVEVYKERCREARGLRMLDDLRADLRYAGRTLAKSPSFSITAILTLALGIGANTGLFTMMDTLLLRPVPVQDPSSLYQVFGHNAKRIKFGSFSIREYDNVIAGESGIHAGDRRFAGSRQVSEPKHGRIRGFRKLLSDTRRRHRFGQTHFAGRRMCRRPRPWLY